MRWWFLLAFIPAVVAQSLPEVTIQSSQYETHGEVAVDGHVQAYVDTHGTSWRLEADHIRLEVDEGREVFVHGASFQRESGTTQWNASHATGNGQSLPDAYIGIFNDPAHPLPAFHLNATCMHVAADAQGQLAAKEVVATNGRQQRVVDVNDALRLQACQSAEIELRGDFLVVMWAWNIELQGDEGRGSWRTGAETVEDAGEARVNEIRQAYLYVINGTLRLPTSSEAGFYALHVEAGVQGTMRFDEYEILGHGIEGEETEMRGELQVASRRNGDTTQNDIAIRELQAWELQQHLAPMTQSAAPSDSTAWVIGLLVAVVALPASWWIRRLQIRSWRRLNQDQVTGADAHVACGQELMVLHRFGRARWHFRRALRVDRSDALAWDLLGRCHFEDLHLQRARRCLERAYHHYHHDEEQRRGYTAYLVARCHARQRRAAQAVAWMHTAGAIHAEYYRRAMREADFASIHDHPEFQSLFGGIWLASK